MPASALRNGHEDMERAGMWDKFRLLWSLGLTGWAPLQIRKTPSDRGGVLQKELCMMEVWSLYIGYKLWGCL